MDFNPILRSTGKFAWSTNCQIKFGDYTNFDSTISKHLSLAEPVILKENIEQWNNRGSVGSGHDWATERGIVKKHVEFELTDQPAPVDFLGYLLAMFFRNENAGFPSGGTYDYYWETLDNLNDPANELVTSFGLCESGEDKLVRDVACTTLKISGDGQDRLQVGGSFVGSKIETPFTHTWSSPTANSYLYNYSGTFKIGTDTRTTQLKGFDLSLESGIKVDSAWQKQADPDDRLYPSVWIYTAERDFSLSLTLIADENVIQSFEDNYAGTTQNLDLEINCLGANSDSFKLVVPKAVVTSLEETYEEDILTLNIEVEGHCGISDTSPLSIQLVNGSSDIYMEPVTAS